MLEQRLEAKIAQLYKMLDLYSSLTKSTRHDYGYRIQGIELQIEVLEELKDNRPDCWMDCYNQDFAESRREQK